MKRVTFLRVHLCCLFSWLWFVIFRSKCEQWANCVTQEALHIRILFKTNQHIYLYIRILIRARFALASVNKTKNPSSVRPTNKFLLGHVLCRSGISHETFRFHCMQSAYQQCTYLFCCVAEPTLTQATICIQVERKHGFLLLWLIWLIIDAMGVTLSAEQGCIERTKRADCVGTSRSSLF